MFAQLVVHLAKRGFRQYITKSVRILDNVYFLHPCLYPSMFSTIISYIRDPDQVEINIPPSFSDFINQGELSHSE